LELSADGLDFQLVPIGEPDRNHVIHAKVLVAVPGFKGEYEASIEPQEFLGFARGLDNLSVSLSPGDSAVLEPFEHDFSLTLTMGTGGHIGGTYRFQGGRFDGATPAVLSGEFAMDQSYLPELRRQVTAMLDILQPPSSL
jgi:hypothetical protein